MLLVADLEASFFSTKKNGDPQAAVLIKLKRSLVSAVRNIKRLVTTLTLEVEVE